GLDTVWYIGGYNFLIAGLLRAAAGEKRRWFGGAQEDAIELQVAVTKAALLDMDIVISVYVEASRRERAVTLAQLAGEFETAVGGVVDVVAGAA
ncbi:UNVERIFIED_CONTAM: protoglobin domain-containing protein, partial [Bacteroidetes bacterium 56_B9]